MSIHSMSRPPNRFRAPSVLLAALISLTLACSGDSKPTTDPDGGPGGPPDAGPKVGLNCGDGVLQADEVCDDRNALGGDGCSAKCDEIEIGWTCPEVGGFCNSNPACGNGKIEAPETCDDRNQVGDDGCSATCETELGWTCPQGSRCRATKCNDGVKAGAEQCEDGNANSGDGCSSTCLYEAGYACDTLGQACTKTTCGDGSRRGLEACDDGNSDTGDGCSPLCTFEPKNCNNGSCDETCGDNIILPNGTEACDDGNTRPGDGCSATCTLEAGFACTQIQDDPPDIVELPVVYRDFKPYNSTAFGNGSGHIDFENGGGSGAYKGIVQTNLNANGKPVWANPTVTSATPHTEASFNQWYVNTTGVNVAVVDTLKLPRIGNGVYEINEVKNTFFPLDNRGWVAQSKETPVNGHNFSFTSEVRYWFEYKGTETLAFTGDDDLWVFINRKLAVDIGGLHPKVSDSVTLATKATALGLTVGGIYEAAVFHAERHTGESNFQLTLTNFVSRRTECVALCGNSVVDPGEQCDDGTNNGGYGECDVGCFRGARCGDGTIDRLSGENCDDGNTADGDTCPATCKAGID